MKGTVPHPESLTAFKSGPCRTFRHQKRNLRHIRVDLVRRTGLGKEETAIRSDRHLFLLNLKGKTEDGEYFIDGRSVPFVRRAPGSVLFLPAGRRWSGWEIGEQSAAFLAISVDSKLTMELIEKHALPARALMPCLALDDAILTHAAWRIGEEMRDKTPLTDLLIESYVKTMFVQIFRRGHHATKERKTGGLSPTAFNRVVEKIDEDPAREINIAQLAGLAGLSVPHFCRAFKETAGCPPYAFVLRRRIEMAKSYLQFSAMSVTDIALACGFSSSSHFANMFKRQVGVAPLNYRGR